MSAQVPSFQLNNDTKIPAVGMGCWIGVVGGGQRVIDMCTKALKNGYRHFDTASVYGESFTLSGEVGEAINASRIPREEIYITTKLPNDAHHKVLESFEESLKKLGCGYVDLYLMHWPFATMPDSTGKTRRLPPDEHPTFVDTWKDMEKLLDTGKVKTIGVSNFSVKTLTELLPHCTVIPAINQVQLHPCLPQVELKAFCEEKGIILTAYTPLGRAESRVLLEHETIVDISKSLGVTPAQVLLSWSVQKNIIVIPKSEDDERMQANINLVHLSDEDIDRINKIHEEPGMHQSLLK
ncbi:NADP-dependent oxidoreductase domain superfamily protein [Pleurotus pulmonarius]